MPTVAFTATVGDLTATVSQPTITYTATVGGLQITATKPPVAYSAALAGIVVTATKPPVLTSAGLALVGGQRVQTITITRKNLDAYRSVFPGYAIPDMTYPA